MSFDFSGGYKFYKDMIIGLQTGYSGYQEIGNPMNTYNQFYGLIRYIYNFH